MPTRNEAKPRDIPSTKGARRSLKPLVSIALSLVLLALCAGACARENPVPEPERIILIVVDTLRRDHVSAYGKPGNPPAPLASTPNIDRIAQGGQVFTNAVASFHATTMSMASMFTGLTPSIESENRGESVRWNTFAACGMARFREPGSDESCLPRSLPTLAEDMKQAGYWTVGVVSNELLYRPSGFDQGFDEWVEVGLPTPGEKRNIFDSSPYRTAADVNRDVERVLATRPSDHFFLYVHYLDVHDYSLFERSYADSVERFDTHLGELLDHLEANALLDDAVVILTSDHGEILDESYAGLKAARHFGNPSMQPVLEIPLLIKPKTRFDSDVFVRTQDLREWIRDIAGIGDDLPHDLEPDELFLSEMIYRSYRKGRWKSHWPRTDQALLLFDLESDPHETRNLAVDRDPERDRVLAAHRRRIDELSRRLATPPTHVPELSDEDRIRLRALGYIETTEEGFGIPDSTSKPDRSTGP